jgi:Lipopolysaccharide-assembly
MMSETPGSAVRARDERPFPEVLAIGAVVVLALTGCGYHFTAGGQGLPQGIHHVFAPVVLNRTSEPALEAVFTDALREQLARAGTLGGENSEGRLEGELLAVNAAVAQLAPGTSGALTYRVSALLRVRLFRGGTLLVSTDVSGSEDYLPALRADVITTEANRQQALRRLAAAIAADAYARISSG